MRDAVGPGTILGYCTNVHAAQSFDELLSNLDRHALAVKQRLSPERPMGVGLWLPASAAREVEHRGLDERLRDWLGERQLLAYTMNGFPFGDFHADVVKHRVYRPTWAEAERVEYTERLARLLATLVPEGGEGSISTVPIGWPSDVDNDAAVGAAAANLRRVAETLAEIEQRAGRWIHLDLEPEPGCVLDTAADVAGFFERRLLGGADEDRVRRHLGVCHDVCHAAVMFEPQAEAIARYRDAGVPIGKVQLSAAVHAPFDELDSAGRLEAIAQLRQFDEPRYLHQTNLGVDGPLVDDLPEALAGLAEGGDDAEPEPWRVHFHVPLFVERFGRLATTSGEVVEAMRLLAGGGEVRHFEAETYAWGVLPESMRAATLDEGIAEELAWVRRQWSSIEAEG